MVEFFKDSVSFYVSFNRTGMFDTYFRSIVMQIDPNRALEGVYISAKTHFQVETRDVFMPHLSLLYSHLKTFQKKTLMEGIVIGYPLSVRIEAAVLVETNGAPAQWQEILKIPLI